jgi:hypothetical protein
VLENPSAGKFDPPPDPAVLGRRQASARRRWRGLALRLGTVAVAGFAIWYFDWGLHSRRGGGAVTVTIYLAIAVANQAIRMFRKPAAEDPGPYGSTTSITR